MRTIIIGNSAAAVGAIEAIRRHGQDNSITVVADEPHHVYSRPLISYLLGGMVTETQMHYRPPDFYQRLGVETMLGVEVVCIKPQEQSIALAGGEELAYDQLVIATGGRPFVPPAPGAHLKGVFIFARWEDARRIGRYVKERGVESAVVVGGGLIGLKTTEALLAHSIRVTVVELADRILSTIFDQTASKLAESALRRAGVEVITGTTVKEIASKNGQVDHAVLQGGERVACDMIIIAIGMRPNVGLAAGTDIAVNQGIPVDRHMQTSVPHVYAAGDCAEAYDLLLGDNRPIATWPNAYRQGYVAGSAIAGIEQEYEGGFPMNSVEVCGMPTISVGLTNPQNSADGYEIMEKYDREASTYKRLVLRGNRLVGTICVGSIERAGIYTGLIRHQVDIAPFKDNLLAGNFGMISLPKEYRKHLVVGDGIEV